MTEENREALPREHPKDAKGPKGAVGTLYYLLHDLAYILAVITLVFVFVVRLVRVSGSSMYPTLVGEEQTVGIGSTRGDYLTLLSNVVCKEYEKGDIVVACIPQFEDGEAIVKRVIATEGQTVDLRQEADGTWRVYVDGQALTEPYINEPMAATTYPTISFPVQVPEGCYFVMGDNRNHSADSRYTQIGMIDGRYIVGKALMVLVPGQDCYNGNATDWSRIGAVD